MYELDSATGEGADNQRTAVVLSIGTDGQRQLHVAPFKTGRRPPVVHQRAKSNIFQSFFILSIIFLKFLLFINIFFFM